MARGKWQISLRLVFVIVGAMACIATFVSYERRRSARSVQRLKSIEEAGSLEFRSSSRSKWVSWLLGVDACATVRAIDFQADADDEQLAGDFLHGFSFR